MAEQKVEAKPAKAAAAEKYEAAAQAALAKGDCATAMAWYALAGKDNVQRSESVRDGDAKQAARIAGHARRA